MEFTAAKSALLKELNLTQGVVEKKTTIPILSNLLLEVSDSTLRISATDLELGVRCGCSANVKKEGSGTVPAKRLLEIVRSLPEAEVKFKVLENHWVQLNCERSSSRPDRAPDAGGRSQERVAVPDPEKSHGRTPAAPRRVRRRRRGRVLEGRDSSVFLRRRPRADCPHADGPVPELRSCVAARDPPHRRAQQGRHHFRHPPRRAARRRAVARSAHAPR